MRILSMPLLASLSIAISVVRTSQTRRHERQHIYLSLGPTPLYRASSAAILSQLKGRPKACIDYRSASTQDTTTNLTVGDVLTWYGLREGKGTNIMAMRTVGIISRHGLAVHTAESPEENHAPSA